MKTYFIYLAVALLVTLSWTVSSHAVTEYTLSDLYRLAMERSEKIKLSDESLILSETGADKARSALMPRVTAFAGTTRYSDSKYSGGMLLQPESASSWGLRLDQSLSLGGRELKAFEQARSAAQKSINDRDAVRQEYLYAVASAYFDALKAGRALEKASSSVDRLKKHRDAAALRLKVGEVTKTALLRAEAELSGAQAEQAQAANGLKLAKAMLARLAGIESDYALRETPAVTDNLTEPDIGQGLRAVYPECGADILPCLKEKALSGRPELKAALKSVDIAETQVSYAESGHWPTLSIEGVYSRTGTSPSIATLVEETAYGGLKLTLPLFEGGLRRAEVKEAEGKLRQARLTLADYRKTVGIEVEQAYLDYGTQRGVLKYNRDQAAFARDNYRAVSRQFEFGLATSVDVMDANALLISSERRLYEAEYNHALSLLRIRRVVGKMIEETGK